MSDEGIVIRTAFNNQGWQDRCIDPLNDSRCYQCVEKRVNVGWTKAIESRIGEDEDGRCVGIAEEDAVVPPESGGRIQAGQRTDHPCAEYALCSKYCWENFERHFSTRVHPGQVVFFVFKNRDTYYTLWGRSRVSRVTPNRQEIHFEPFDPLPQDRWVEKITDRDLVGNQWRQGTFRYIGADQVHYLDHLIGTDMPYGP
jgi:hypothetical protein